jgi:hypothetical protein
MHGISIEKSKGMVEFKYKKKFTKSHYLRFLKTGAYIP